VCVIRAFATRVAKQNSVKSQPHYSSKGEGIIAYEDTSCSSNIKALKLIQLFSANPTSKSVFSPIYLRWICNKPMGGGQGFVLKGWEVHTCTIIPPLHLETILNNPICVGGRIVWKYLTWVTLIFQSRWNQRGSKTFSLPLSLLENIWPTHVRW
jgi:hypothetical protein